MQVVSDGITRLVKENAELKERLGGKGLLRRGFFCKLAKGKK